MKICFLILPCVLAAFASTRADPVLNANNPETRAAGSKLAAGSGNVEPDTPAAGDMWSFVMLPPGLPVPLATAPNQGMDVYVASDRTSGAGTGTAGNPLDGGSRAKFEAILAGTPSGRTVHLLPGTYHTLGRLGAGVLPDRITIQGAGMDQTTILIDPGAVVPPGVVNRIDFFNTSGQTRSSVVVSDLTLDGNLQNQPNGTQVNAGILTAFGRYERVHLQHWGDTPAIATSSEAFGLVFGGAGTSGYYEILHCVVDAPAGNTPETYSYGSALGINAGGPDPDASHPARFGGVIFGNRVTGGPRCNGISLAGRFDGLKVLANTVYGAARGFHQDTIFASEAGTPTGPMYSRNVTIAFNSFLDCSSGIGLSGLIGAVGDGGLYNYVSSHNEIRGVGVFPGVNAYGQGNDLFLGGGVYGFHSDYDHLTGQGIDFGIDNAGSSANRFSVSNLRVARTVAVYPVAGTPSYASGNCFEDGSPLPYLGEHSSREVFAGRDDAGVRRRLKMTFSERNGQRTSWPTYEVHIVHHGPSDGSAEVEAVLRVTASKAYHTGIFIKVSQLSGAPVHVALDGNINPAVAAPDEMVLSGSATLAMIEPAAEYAASSFTVTALGAPANANDNPLLTCALENEDRPRVLGGTAPANVPSVGTNRVRQSVLTGGPGGSVISPDMSSVYLQGRGPFSMYHSAPDLAGTTQRLINFTAGAVTVTASGGTVFLSSAGDTSTFLTIPAHGNVTVEAAPSGNAFVVVSRN